MPTPTTPPDPRGDFLVKATVAIVTLIILLVFALVFMSAFGRKVDVSLMTLVGQVVATVLGFGTAVWAWQFASSKGSQDKDAVIAASAPVPPSPTSATTITTTTTDEPATPATAITVQPTGS